MHVTNSEHKLLADFADLTYPVDLLDHSEHVRLAWTLLAEQPLFEAIQTFRRLLRAYTVHHAAADKYNETISCFYLVLIRDRMDRLDTKHDWTEFRQKNGDLFVSAKKLLDEWYPGGLAYSEEAKVAFHLPSSTVSCY